MKTKNYNLLICLFIFSCICGCSSARFDKIREAKGDHPPIVRAKGLTRLMTNSLLLDTNQAEEVYNINFKYANESESAVDEKSGDLSTLLKLRKIAKSKDKELKEVLSKEQFKLYQTQKEDYQERLKKGLRNAKKRQKENQN